MINLAILSPSENALSETFIQQHRNISGVKVNYYFNGHIPAMLSGYGKLVSLKFLNRLNRQLKLKWVFQELSGDELCLLESFKREKIDCVLAEYGKTGAEVLNVCKRLKIPLIVHFHGYDASKFEILNKYKSKYIEMFRYSKAIVVVSRVMEEKIIELGCPHEKIVYNPYGPDDSFFNLNPDFNKRIFISLGRMVDKKAPYYILFAFKKVLETFPDSRLVMAGEGPLLNTCKNLLRYLQIQNQVSLPGAIDRLQYQELLLQSWAYVQHSITADDGDMEGTPVAILEASAAGLPVISTFHAGIPDVIIDGTTGYLGVEHDVNAMYLNMMKVIENADNAKKMGLSGKKNIKENFSSSQHLNILKKIILQL